MLKLIPKIPLYKSFRSIGKPKMLPLNLTINATYHCPSRCQTCNIWKKNADEFTLDEWEKTFKSIGKGPFWLIISGGEPFSRKDLPEICKLAGKYLKPKVINIPTNGFFHETISEKVSEILDNCPQSQIVINFSLDGIEKKHDEIRRLENSFENLLKSYSSLKKIKNERLTIGIHSVISKLNYQEIPEIYNFVNNELNPDSYITEVAEPRTELNNKDLDVFPESEEYEKAINFLLEKMKKQKFKKFSRATHSIRMEYYEMAKKIIRQKKQIIPCYAGFASGQITAEGDVWSCCVRGESMGNLRENGYDFKKIWFGKKADEMRKSIKNKECYCPLASASYTNMLMNAKKLAKISSKMILR